MVPQGQPPQTRMSGSELRGGRLGRQPASALARNPGPVTPEQHKDIMAAVDFHREAYEDHNRSRDCRCAACRLVRTWDDLQVALVLITEDDFRRTRGARRAMGDYRQ